MKATKLVGAALLVASLGGDAVAGEREGIREKVRAAAARLFTGEDVKFAKLAVYEVKGRDAGGRELALLITEGGAPFRGFAPAMPAAPSPGGRGFLGIRFASQEDPTVADTIEGTAARKAGLKAGDRIVRVGERPVGSALVLAEALAAFGAGQKVKLILERDGWRKAMEVTLGARPANLDDGEDEDEDHDDDGGKHDEGGEHHEKGLQKHDERGERHGEGDKDEDRDE